MRRTADCAGVSDATQCMRPVPSLQLVDSLHFVALVSHATETVTQHLSPRLFVGDEGEAQMGRLACPLAPLYMRVHTAWGACADGLSPSIDLCAPAWPEGDFSMLRELSACAEQPAALPPMPCAPPPPPPPPPSPAGLPPVVKTLSVTLAGSMTSVGHVGSASRAAWIDELLSTFALHAGIRAARLGLVTVHASGSDRLAVEMTITDHDEDGSSGSAEPTAAQVVSLIMSAVAGAGEAGLAWGSLTVLGSAIITPPPLPPSQQPPPSAQPPPPPTAQPPPSSLPPARPGTAYSAVMRSTCVVAGDVASFDAEGFRLALLAQFGEAEEVTLRVTSASVRVEVTLTMASSSAAMRAADTIATTPVATMQSSWFASVNGGAGVTIENVPTSEVDSLSLLLAATPPPSSPLPSPPSPDTETVWATSEAMVVLLLAGALGGLVIYLIIRLGCRKAGQIQSKHGGGTSTEGSTPRARRLSARRPWEPGTPVAPMMPQTGVSPHPASDTTPGCGEAPPSESSRGECGAPCRRAEGAEASTASQPSQPAQPATLAPMAAAQSTFATPLPVAGAPRAMPPPVHPLPLPKPQAAASIATFAMRPLPPLAPPLQRLPLPSAATTGSLRPPRPQPLPLPAVGDAKGHHGPSSRDGAPPHTPQASNASS